MTLPKELLDELLTRVEHPKELVGEAGLMKELKIKLMEPLLGAALTAHLGYDERKVASPGQGSRRNGTSTKELKGQDGEMPIAVPRDRGSNFEPSWGRRARLRSAGGTKRLSASTPLGCRSTTSRPICSNSTA